MIIFSAHDSRTAQIGQNGPSLESWSKIVFHVTQNVLKMGQNRVKS